jgi:hypothetical protein
MKVVSVSVARQQMAGNDRWLTVIFARSPPVFRTLDSILMYSQELQQGVF